MGGQLKISTINALRIFNQAFGLIFRRSEDHLHLIPTNEGEGENGDIGSLRPFSINLRSGLVSIGNGLKVGGSVTGNLTGNADTATKIKTARKIGGVAFDGSADINLPGVNATGNQNTTGNAATATKLQTARNINGVPFDGTKDITLTPKDLDAYSKSEVQSALAGKQPLDNTLTNLSGKDVAGLLAYLGLKETLNPTKRVSIGNIGTGVFDGSTPCINIGDSDSGFIGSADGVLDIYCNAAKVGYIDGNGLHMLTDIHFDNARMTTNGDIFGSVWGNNWLSIWITNQLNTRGTIDWINSELAVRDNNINTRATWDYVNQTFARKNTGSIQDWGWILDDSTGFIMQWGTLGNSNGTYNFPRAFPVGCFAVFVTNTNAQGTQVDNAFGYPVSNSQFFAATKSSGIANLVNNFPVAWLALGR